MCYRNFHILLLRSSYTVLEEQTQVSKIKQPMSGNTRKISLNHSCYLSLPLVDMICLIVSHDLWASFDSFVGRLLSPFDKVSYDFRYAISCSRLHQIRSLNRFLPRAKADAYLRIAVTALSPCQAKFSSSSVSADAPFSKSDVGQRYLVFIRF